MPARSNAFQRAMFLLRKHLADDATSVDESGFVMDLVTGAEREVDVLITRTVAGATIVVGVECTDLKNPADVTWVEKMAEKHRDLATHALILASASGFTKNAALKADRLNIVILRERSVIGLERCAIGHGEGNQAAKSRPFKASW